MNRVHHHENGNPCDICFRYDEEAPVMTHTPGPWIVKDRLKIGGKRKLDQSGCWRINRSNGQSIAKTVLDSWQTHEEERANARLIAAAPELLEALEELLRCSAIPESWAAPARAAIAKARGE